MATLGLNDVVAKLRGVEENQIQPFILQWRQIYYRTSIHTTGTCPRFYPLRYEENAAVTVEASQLTPTWWLSENYDIIFDNHLLNRYPREPRILREFRKSVYRPYQTAPLLECIQSLSACIFGESKYTLEVEDKADMEYLRGRNFHGKTFIGYFEWMFKAICEDPNSLFVVVPKNDRKNTGEKVEPTIMHVPTSELIYLTEDEIVFYEPFTQRGYAWYINETGYFKFKKDGEDYVNVNGQDGYYAHLFHRTPTHFAGGIWNTLKYYDSYLKSAQAYCDDFVAAHSDVQLINKEACFPFIQAIQTDCPQCNGVAQVSFCSTCKSKNCMCEVASERWEKIDCPGCKGTGHIQSVNPGQWWQVPEKLADKELIKVINFDVNVNKFMSEYAASILEGIKKALHQQYVDESQSGIAKEIDREAEYLYRSTVSNGVWNLMEACLIDILSLRHMVSSGTEYKPELPNYEIVRPTDFALKTEGEILAEYKESTESKMPDFVRKKQVEMYVDKVFGGNPCMKRKVSFINEADPYSVMPVTDKAALLASGGINRDAFLFSMVLPELLDEVIRKKGEKWFIPAKYDEVKKEVDALFAAVPKLPEPQAKTTVKENV